ncbi:MAG: hypothetical protein HC927_10810 [Deltaproteobacteria bacterium]|nr:hypothetical protein [Deltaproteobacteria bacterium]
MSIAFARASTPFRAQRNPIPVDYEHASVRDVAKAPAAGWLQRLELRGEDLWGIVEWTQTAADEIRSGAYRYCSGVFLFDRPDRKSGKPIGCSLHSVALTNTPFIDDQRPIVLSQRRVALSTSGGRMSIERGAFEEALKRLKGDEFSADQLMELIESMSKETDPESGAAELEVEIDDVDDGVEMADREKPDEDKALAITPDAAAVMGPAAYDASGAGVPMDPAGAYARLEELASMSGMDIAGLLAYLAEMLSGAAGGGNPAALGLSVRADAQAATIRALTVKLRRLEDAERARARAESERKRKALDSDVETLVKSGVVLRADAAKLRALAHRDEIAYRDMVSVLRNRPAVPTGREASAARVEAAGDASIDMAVDFAKPEIVALNQSLIRMGLSEEAAKKRVKQFIASQRVSAG